jgi:hypothetical protein
MLTNGLRYPRHLLNALAPSRSVFDQGVHHIIPHVLGILRMSAMSCSWFHLDVLLPIKLTNLNSNGAPDSK